MAQGRSRQAVAAQLAIHPGDVALVDDLEREGNVERKPNSQDRRHYALHLTGAGHAVPDTLADSAIEHEDDLCAALSDDEHIQLTRLLRRITDQQGLTHAAVP